LASRGHLRIDLTDPDDRAFIEVAAEGRAVALVTGSIRHFAAACALVQVPLKTPAEFIGFWLGPALRRG
jgi:predicted nucleic acid-binding protein